MLKNKEIFKNKLLFDFGCGFGLLSIFLSETDINLKFYNYDNFSQIDKSCVMNFYEKIKAQLNIDIPYYDTITIDKADIVVCSGFYVGKTLTNQINPEYLMLDNRYLDCRRAEDKQIRFTLNEILKEYEMIDEYSDLAIFKK